MVEAIVATLVVVTGVIGVAQLFVIAARANDRARAVTMATILASDKLEQLSGALASTPTGGSLASNVAGFFDATDAEGRVLRSGARLRLDAAALVRRWTVEPLAANPARAAVIHVVVMPRGTRAAEAVHVVTVRRVGVP